ncbi:MAG: hypothetical protein M1831_001302 [Alyxoria varia]|nr:MAG: hypothetical protein M1831_001302 [Alyxoria varia]
MKETASRLKYSCAVTVKDRNAKAQRAILTDLSGVARAGELVAPMRPSRSGKTTLLNLLAHRKSAVGAQTLGKFLLDGTVPEEQVLRDVSSFVEQEDVLVGSLTARWSLVDTLLAAFGVPSCADTLVGTLIRKGISGGRKSDG